MRFRAIHAQWFSWHLRTILALAGLHPAVGAPVINVVLTTNTAPCGFVEVSGVESGEFSPVMWQAGTLNLLPDLHSPLLEPRSGKYRNIYAPSAVETPAGYRLFYGAWDGVPSGNDRIYSARTDASFQEFSDRHGHYRAGLLHSCM